MPSPEPRRPQCQRLQHHRAKLSLCWDIPVLGLCCSGTSLCWNISVLGHPHAGSLLCWHITRLGHCRAGSLLHRDIAMLDRHHARPLLCWVIAVLGHCCAESPCCSNPVSHCCCSLTVDRRKWAGKAGGMSLPACYIWYISG